MQHQQVAPPSAFASPCPACREPGGRPQSVEVRANERVVTFACAKCDHVWAMTTDAPSALLFADPPGGLRDRQPGTIISSPARHDPELDQALGRRHDCVLP
jgi:hypothetical protein